MIKGDTTVFISNGPMETIKFGEKLGTLLNNSDIVTLKGDLGAGKTCFVKGLAKGLLIDEEEVSSPTFVIAQVYEGRRVLYHIDLYRMNNEHEVENAGISEYLDSGSITVIEWPNVYPKLLLYDRIEVEIEKMGESARTITLTPYGEQSIKILERLRCDDTGN